MARTLAVSALNASSESFVDWVGQVVGACTPASRRHSAELCWHAREWKHAEYDVLLWVDPKSDEGFEEAACRALRDVQGVDAAFLSGGDERAIIVLAREHGDIDREVLVQIEDELSERFGTVEIRVRAHQGRPITQYKGLAQIV